MQIGRRKLLTLAAASAAAWTGRTAAAALAVPAVDRLELTVLIDSTTAVFGVAFDTPMIRVTPPPITRDYHRVFAGQWGYSLLARSSVGATVGTMLIDFGYTPEALLNNMALLGVDAAAVDAMVLSHGHYDHFGGLDGLLATGRVRRGTPLFIGGEEAFCARVRGTDPDGPSFGAIDRAALLRAGIVPVISGDPRIVAGQGFTTGRIPFVSPERPRVPSGMLPGQGCDRALLDNGLANGIVGAGPLGEEGGWRGYLLPRLLERGGEARASVIVGIVWALWHLPIMAMFPDWRNGVPFAAYLPLYVVGVVGLSFVLTRVWLLGSGSLVPCIWLHGVTNAVGSVAFEQALWTSRWSVEASTAHFTVVTGAVATLLIIFTRPTTDSLSFI